MASYLPEGRGHLVLRALSGGPKHFNELREVIPMSPSKRLKFRFLTRTLLDDSLAETGGSIYTITLDGLQALGRLDAGQEVTVREGVPNVRVYVSPQA